MTAHAEHKVDVLTSNTYGSLMTLLTSADRIETIRPEASAAMREYVAYVQREDLRIAECITDAKGDRSKSAAAQETLMPIFASLNRDPTELSFAAPSSTSLVRRSRMNCWSFQRRE